MTDKKQTVFERAAAAAAEMGIVRPRDSLAFIAAETCSTFRDLGFNEPPVITISNFNDWRRLLQSVEITDMVFDRPSGVFTTRVKLGGVVFAWGSPA